MVTKREIAAAHNEMIEALGLWAHLAGMQPLMPGSYERTVTLPAMERTLIEKFDTWDELRLSLEGEGPAVARATSIAAAKSRLMGKQSLRRDILVMVVAHHNKWQVGMTSEQIQARIPEGTHQTVSARVSELVNTYQLLHDSGRKIETSSGSKATVWEPTDECRQLVADQITGRSPGA